MYQGPVLSVFVLTSIIFLLFLSFFFLLFVFFVFFVFFQDAASPYAHLIMEDHAKLLGLATRYLQTYG